MAPCIKHAVKRCSVFKDSDRIIGTVIEAVGSELSLEGDNFYRQK